MQLTLQSLANELTNYYSDIIIHTNGSTNLKQAILLSPNVCFHNLNYLYCGNITSIPDGFPENACFLFIDTPSSQQTLENYIVIAEEKDIHLLFMRIQEIMIRIWSWYAQVLEVSTTSDDFTNLLSASEPVFKDKFYFYSIYHNDFFHNNVEDKLIHSYWESIVKSYYNPSAKIYDFTFDLLAQKHSLQAPTLITLPDSQEYHLFCNVFLDHVRMGVFVVLFDNLSMKDSYFSYLQILSSCAITMFRRILHTPEISLNGAIYRLLSGKTVSPEILSKLCQNENWNAKGCTFRIGVIHPQDSSRQTFFTEQLLYRNILSSFLKKCKILFFENNILLIENFTDNDTSDEDEDVANSLLYFLKNIHATIGISVPFSNLSQLHIFYEQAKTIVTNLSKPTNAITKHTASLHEYSYYMLYDMIENFASTHVLSHYIHPDILKLAEYDKDGKNHLLLSLYYYLLNDRSYQECAQKQYVHRNTFAYRIKKVLHIINADLTEENVRLSILLSICMYWYLHPEIDPIGISDWNRKNGI